MFYQDLFNCMFGWWRSRRWWRMSLLAFLPVTLFLTAFSLVIWGALTTSQTLGGRYFALVEDEVEASFDALLKPVASAIPVPGQESSAQTSVDSPSADAGTSSGASRAPDEQADPAGEVLSRVEDRRVQVPLRRILQLGNYNPRVAYVVASQMARHGRSAMAARMMRDIAPLGKQGVGKVGFAYAHAWLAEYALMSWKGSESQAETLLRDLEAAERGGATLTVPQVKNFANLLEHFKRTPEALNLLSDYARRYPEHPELYVMYALLSERSGHVGVLYQDAIKAAREGFQAKQQAGKMLTQDWFYAVQLEMHDKQIDFALVIANAGFRSDLKNPELRRLFSDVLLAKHQALSASLDGKAAVGTPLASTDGAPSAPPNVLPDLKYLEMAHVIDSANPALSPEVAKAIAMGQNMSPELKQALESSLAEGTAPGITHLILANHILTNHILTGDSPKNAIPHLRLALSKMPNSPVVMNNLAYALMKYDPDKLPEAQQLMERALSVPGSSLIERASMLDTLGEIRLVQGETLKAIELLEQAIELDGSKLGTRERLIVGYRKADMPELADAQLRRIDELKSQK